MKGPDQERNMITLFFSLLLLIATSFACEASDLSLTVEVEPNPVITGLPAIVNIRIVSDKEFTLDGDFNDCDGHTKLNVTDTSGNTTDYETEMSCPSGREVLLIASTNLYIKG